MPKSSPAPAVHLRLHRSPSWRRGGDGPWQALERKHAALLAWLWLEGATPRARLAALLWPQAGDERGRGNLRQRLLKLRQDAGDLVQDQQGMLSLLPGAVLVLPPDPPGAALLQPLEFDDCDQLARWLDNRRETDRERRKREWLAEVREAAQGQRLDDALYAADQLLQTDRESEEAYRVLMEVYYLRGDHAAAISAGDRCRDMLRQLYGVLPSAATRGLSDTILQAARSADAAQSAWAPTPAATRQLPPTVLRPPLLVARDAAMGRLMQGWQAGHTLCVAGVSGVGKSRLLADWAGAVQAAAAAAGQPGAVVQVAARPGDAVLPYASLSRLLLAAIDRFCPPLDSPAALQAARVLPRLASLIGRSVAPVQSDYERSQALLALGRLLGQCTQRGALALVLDDLQFADPASVSALRVLAEAAPPSAAGPATPATTPTTTSATTSATATPADAATPALRFAFGLRPDEAGAEVQALLGSLRSAGGFVTVELAELSAEASAALLASLALPGLDMAAWAGRLWRQVGGNPAFLLEAVKLLLSTEPALAQVGAGQALPLPASIEAVIQRRIDLLSPRARHLAQLAAIAGSGYSVGLASAALAMAPIELGEPLTELAQRQVFNGREFVHDVVARVTAQSVPATVAEFMHRFVAEHLVGQGAEPASIAGHWLACAEWAAAGRCYLQAARQAGAAALANEQAALLDSAIAAFERTPAAHDELFAALTDRADVFESAGHAGVRPQVIERMQALARTEAQHITVLTRHNGWLVNLAQPIEEAAILAAIPRALALQEPELAWLLARMLGWHWAMNGRADEGLALLQAREDWVMGQPDGRIKSAYRLARSSIFAFSDQLQQAIAEGRLAIAEAEAAQDWPNVLPAMSNVGLMHCWRGEYPAAHELLTAARALRLRLYGGGGSGVKIDTHLGAVLYELGQHDAAQAMLEGALAEMRGWVVSDYGRMDMLLAENNLAQMHIALGRADAAAAALASDCTGLSDRFVGRRLALRLRWQRVFGPSGRGDEALLAQLQAIVDTLASPFNRTLMALELARHRPPAQALAELAALQSGPACAQRPGLQLHATALLAHTALQLGDTAAAQAWAAQAHSLRQHCAPYDMSVPELGALLAGLTAAD